MKKTILSILISSIFLIGTPFMVQTVSAQNLSIRDFVNLLIAIGVITPDKVPALNAFLTNYDNTSGLNNSGVSVSPTVTTSPSITVLSPNGGEILEEGQNYTITWSSKNIPSTSKIIVDIFQYDGEDDLFGSHNNQIAVLPYTATSYTWKIAGNSGNWSIGLNSISQKFAKLFGINVANADVNQYKISVRAYDESFLGGHASSDVSDSYFKIVSSEVSTSPSITDTHTLTFDPNGGRGSVRKQNMNDGEPTRLVPNTFTRTGYAFLGWGDRPYGNADNTYPVADKVFYTLYRDQTLYALWKPFSSNQSLSYIVFEPNGALVSKNITAKQLSQEVVSNKTTRLSPNPFTAKSGYVFAGWSRLPKGDIAYSDQGYITFSSETPSYTSVSGAKIVILYAIWVPVGSTISTPTSVTPPNQTPAPVSTPTQAPTCTSFTYSGWTVCSANGTQNQTVTSSSPAGCTGGNPVTSRSCTPPPAKSISNNYTITFDPNGGIGYMAPLSFSSGVVNLSNTGFSKEGFTFRGWSTTRGGSVSYQGFYTSVPSSDMTLYAVWEQESESGVAGFYRVIYDGNGATEGAPKVYGSSYYTGTKLSVWGRNTLARPGYNFNGWNTKSDGSGQYYSVGSYMYVGTSDLTLYAVWTPIGASADSDNNYGTVLVSWDSVLKLIEALK